MCTKGNNTKFQFFFSAQLGQVSALLVEENSCLQENQKENKLTAYMNASKYRTSIIKNQMKTEQYLNLSYQVTNVVLNKVQFWGDLREY